MSSDPTTRVTPAGADWLASASRFPRSVHALWSHRPAATSVLPCGTAFDVVSTPVLFGRRMLDRLWSAGPGSGPVALHHDRLWLFAAPGTADRLPTLLGWEEWDSGTEGAETIPPLLCHGAGEAVTVPAVYAVDEAPRASRWLVAPDVRYPWLPDAEALLRACLRAVRAGRSHGRPLSIFASAEPGAKVYDVSRRR
ncbi:bifunctional DNA primase/polymerase [Streptomyces sparsus]